MSGVLHGRTGSTDPRPRYDVLQQISSRDGSLKWLRIGLGIKSADGTIDVYLDIVIDGHRLRLREIQADDSSKDEASASPPEQAP